MNSYAFREGALATERYTGGNLIAQYPLDKFRRIDFGAGVTRLQQSYENPEAEAFVCAQAAAQGVDCYPEQRHPRSLHRRLTQETTKFAEFGPLAGSTFNVGVEFSPPIGGTLSRHSFAGDFRKYLRLGSTTTLLALRAKGFYSAGSNPAIFYFGGNQELRGYPYLGFVGTRGFFANVELRLPLIHLMATPIGILGPVRGTVYFGSAGPASGRARIQVRHERPGDLLREGPDLRRARPGYHLVDGRASFGFGLQVFFLGYPMHFDWTKFTDLKVVSEGWKFNFWIGYDF